jgi:hypothetical protein
MNSETHPLRSTLTAIRRWKARHPELIDARFAYVSVSRASGGRTDLHERRTKPRRTLQPRRVKDLRTGGCEITGLGSESDS